MSASKLASAFALKTAAPPDTHQEEWVLLRQYVSDPLAAQTVAGTVKAIARASESSELLDASASLEIHFVSNDGLTERGTAFSSGGGGRSQNEFARALTNRKFPIGWSGAGVSIATVVIQSGDRLVVELGYTTLDATAASSASLEFGDAAAQDLAENQTDTLQLNPWIEFSQDLVFQVTARPSRALLGVGL